jgi:hypothetical protein
VMISSKHPTFMSSFYNFMDILFCLQESGNLCLEEFSVSSLDTDVNETGCSKSKLERLLVTPGNDDPLVILYNIHCVVFFNHV